ncbi:Otud3, partial [Symbiodinium necroappetens]
SVERPEYIPVRSSALLKRQPFVSGPGPKIPASLHGFIQQAVQKAIQDAIAGFDIASLLGGAAAPAAPRNSPPVGSRAHRRRKARLKKAASNLARAGGSQAQASPTRQVTLGPETSAQAKGKGKGAKSPQAGKAQGKAAAASAPQAGKGKGAGKAQPTNQPKAEDQWTTVQRRKPDKPEAQWKLRATDWDAKVYMYHEVAEALQSLPGGGSFKAVVLCESQDQLDTIAGLLKHSGTQHAVRLVVVAAKASEGERCPGEVGSQRAFRHVHFSKIFTAGLQVPGPAVTGAALKPVAETPTMILYVRFHKQFMLKAKWEDALRAPQAAFHLWVATHGLRVRDSFAWSKERQNQEVSSVFGLARVDVADAQAIVALSGQGLFVDPSKRSGFPDYTTEWIDKLPKEQPLDYLARAGALGAQFGLVCGTRSLGRRTARDPSKPTARTWMLENTPHWWTPAQAERAVSTVFSEVKMLRQRRSRSGCTFSFRGSHTTAHDMVALPLEAENGAEGQTLWCRWAPPARTVQRQAIHTSGSWSLVRPADPFATSETTAQPKTDKPEDPQGTNSPADVEMAPAGQAQAQAQVKQRAPDASAPPAKRRQAEQRAIPPGLVLHEIPKEGNCLFEAFAKGLAATTGKEQLHHLLVRAELIQHFVKNRSVYEAQWDKELPNGSQGESFELYIEEMAKPKVWGGLLEIRALARMHNVRITVVPRALSEQVFTVKPGQKQRHVGPAAGTLCGQMALRLPGRALAPLRARVPVLLRRLLPLGAHDGASRHADEDVVVQARAEDQLEAMVQECATGPKRKFATTDPAAAQKILKNHFGSHHRGGVVCWPPSGRSGQDRSERALATTVTKFKVGAFLRDHSVDIAVLPEADITAASCLPFCNAWRARGMHAALSPLENGVARAATRHVAVVMDLKDAGCDATASGQTADIAQ